MVKDKQYFITIGNGTIGDYILAKDETQAKKRFIKWVLQTIKIRETF